MNGNLSHLLSFSLLCFFSTLASVQARTFTDAKGRQIEAELVAHSGKNIVISAKGKEFSVPITSFSAPDQEYINGWIAENPDAIDVDYKFRYYADHKRESGFVRESGRAIDDSVKIKKNKYDILVYNNDSKPITDVDIRYEIYVADFVVMKGKQFSSMAYTHSKSEKLEVIAGELKDQTIPVKGRIDASREFFTEFYVDKDGAYTGATAEDKVIGVTVRVFKAGKKLDEYSVAEDTNRMKKMSWQDKKAGEQAR